MLSHEQSQTALRGKMSKWFQAKKNNKKKIRQMYKIRYLHHVMSELITSHEALEMTSFESETMNGKIKLKSRILLDSTSS